jgi:hypothetical protein
MTGPLTDDKDTLMISLESLEHTTFEPLVGNVFVVAVVGGTKTVELTLVEVNTLGHRRPDAKRNPFALLFRGPVGLRLPQGIYRFEHASTGALEFFITQVSAKPEGCEFEAIFT